MRVRNGKVWDEVRGKWLVLTPEEWVRQGVIAYLTTTCDVQPHRIGREVRLVSGKRADLVVYDLQGEVVMVVECKAQSVPLTREVLEQIAGYNLTLGGSRYLAITNGNDLFCMQFNVEEERYKLMDGFPATL